MANVNVNVGNENEVVLFDAGPSPQAVEEVKQALLEWKGVVDPDRLECELMERVADDWDRFVGRTVRLAGNPVVVAYGSEAGETLGTLIEVLDALSLDVRKATVVRERRVYYRLVLDLGAKGRVEVKALTQAGARYLKNHASAPGVGRHLFERGNSLYCVLLAGLGAVFGERSANQAAAKGGDQ